MKLGWYRFVRGSALTVLVLGASTSAQADDAKKQELKLAQCAASYKTALTACERVADAVACYQRADTDDLACRKAAGAVGHSDVEPAVASKRREVIGSLFVPKKPLTCSGPFNRTCADGHARVPICEQSSQQAIQAGQGIGGNDATVVQDSQGDKDACTGQTLKCPAGFTLIARKGQDLCWDSVDNKNKYQY